MKYVNLCLLSKQLIMKQIKVLWMALISTQYPLHDRVLFKFRTISMNLFTYISR